MILADSRCESDYFFLDGSRGRLFASMRMPASRKECGGAVLCVMPLGEEMNRCRHLVAAQSRMLAASGWAVLCVDSFGCGDSEGEFGEADWQTWTKDLRLAEQWLKTATGQAPNVWAIRHGALIAADAFRDTDVPHVLLWQPIVSGAAALAEMLRVSVASSILTGSGKRRTVDALRSAVLTGEAIEVGGYLITSALAAALDAASLDPWPFGDSLVNWFDVVPEPDEPRVLDDQPASNGPTVAGARVHYRRVPGRRFWSSPDVLENRALARETLQAICDAAGQR